MTARKRGLIAVLALIDVAAVFLAVYLISTSGPEPRVGANGRIFQIPGRETGVPGMLEIILGAPVTANLSINYVSPTGVPGFRRLTVGAKAADFSLPRVGEGPKAHLAQLRVDRPRVVGASVSHPGKPFAQEIGSGARALRGQRHRRRLGQFPSVVDDPDAWMPTAIVAQRVQRDALRCLQPEVQRQCCGRRIRPHGMAYTAADHDQPAHVALTARPGNR